MRRNASIFLLTLIVVVASSSISYSAYRITQITSDAILNKFPKINANGWVVWYWNDDISIHVDTEISLYDGANTTRITDNDYEDIEPRINDDGWIAWRALNGPPDYDIFRFDGTNTNVVTDTREDRNHQMNDEGVVIWESQGDVDSELVMMYSTGTLFGFTNNTYNDTNPQINNNGWVVWQGCVGQTSATTCDSDWEIFLDPVPGSPIQLTDNDDDDINPQINDDGYVVWEGHDGDDSEILLYDGTSIKSLTINAWGEDRLPRINNEGHVVWVGYTGSASEIFLYDGSDTVQLTNNSYEDKDPQISDNGQVVWTGEDGDWEIFLYDGRRTVRLTDNSGFDLAPQINENGWVAWQGLGAVGGTQIFLAIPCTDDDRDDYYLESGCLEPLDCNDTNGNIYPGNSNTHCDCEEPYPQGTTEVCTGGVDEDCDGLTDGGDPDCNGGTCTGSAAASTMGESSAYNPSGLGKHLACFFLPVGVIIAVRIWRKKG